ARGEARNIIAASLIGFTLLFMINAIEGRISIGLTCLIESRYIPLYTPGLIGVYLSIDRIPNRTARGIFIIVAVILALNMSLFINPTDLRFMETYRQDKQTWIGMYQITGDVQAANQAVKKPIYPPP